MTAFRLVIVFLFPAFLAADDKPWIAQKGPSKNWLKRHFEIDGKLARANSADFVFVGDSLTEFWNSTGQPIWEADFLRHNWKVANAGLAADRTEHILWRLTHGRALAKLKPKGFVLMAGTNNLAQENFDSPADVAKAVEEIIATLRKSSPKAKVLLLSILPNGTDADLARRIRETNALTKAMAEKTDGVEFVDLWPTFAEKNRLKAKLTLDGTHLSLRGYELLAREIGLNLKNWL